MPGTIWVLLAGTFINRFGTFVLPFLVLYLRDLGYSAPQSGLAVAMYGVGGIAAVGIGGPHGRPHRPAELRGAVDVRLGRHRRSRSSQAHTLDTILPLTALVGLVRGVVPPAGVRADRRL